MAVLSAIATLGSSILNSLSGASNARRANRLNERLMDKQNAFNLGMWNRTNQYNSVGAQAARLSAAGFNPQLAIGQPAIASPVQSASASPAVVSPSFNAGLGESTMNLIQGQYIKEQTKQEQIKNSMLLTDKQFQVSEKIKGLTEQQARIDNLLSQKNLSDEQRNVYESQKRQIDRQLDFFNEVFDVNVQRARQGLRNDEMTEKSIQSEIDKREHDQLIDEARLSIERFNAQTNRNLSNAQIANLVESTANLTVARKSLEQEFVGKRFDNINTKMDVIKRLKAYKQECENYVRSELNNGVISEAEAKAKLTQLQRISIEEAYNVQYRYGANPEDGTWNNGLDGQFIRLFNYIFNQFGQALGGVGAAAILKK